jgi:predicted GIY-YIG superfamily endonuclease
MWYVYILRCCNGDLYKGCTVNIEERLKWHHAGKVPATMELRPLELITYVVFTDKYKAYRFEKYLKSGSGRAFTNKHFV